MPLARKSPLRRKARLRRTPIRRRIPPGRAPLSRRAVERRKVRFELHFGTDKSKWIRSQACTTCLDPPPSEASHVLSRGAGGTSADLIPQCRTCHRQWHALGRLSFCRKYEIEPEHLAEKATALEEEWQRFQGKQGC